MACKNSYDDTNQRPWTDCCTITSNGKVIFIAMVERSDDDDMMMMMKFGIPVKFSK